MTPSSTDSRPANRKMLVESDPHQTRVAILEDDRLTEIFVERHRHRGLVGNVYKGRVTRVLPGMQAAFVDIGLARDAFLYVSDVGGAAALGGEMDELGLDGAAPDDEAPEDEAPEDDASDDDTPSADSRRRSDRPPDRPIEELLHKGQELILQVVKDPLPNKGARISTHVTLPGRFLVLLPTVRHLGVSRRIDDEEERERLLAVLEELGRDAGGMIVRTVGEGKGQAEFDADRRYLAKLWGRIRERAGKVSAPSLLHREEGVALRTVRDRFSSDLSILWVDGEETYEQIVEFLDQVQPSLVTRVKLAGQDTPLFERFGVEREIEAALRSKVWLKSGGYIVIHPTEALTAIDVNTGRFVGKTNLEETVLETNLEAVEEIVRQIRLRDLGGILVLDLIDMTEEAHRDRVFDALGRELQKDRKRTKVLSISEFGLVEITRKRSRTNLERLLTESCPHCHGSGRIKSTETICLDLRRELLAMAGKRFSGELLLRLHPDVARALQQEERPVLEEVERALGVDLVLQSDPALHHERFDLVEV